MLGEISFDTVVSESGQPHVEGCYRIGANDWKVFYFTQRHKGRWWSEDPIVRTDVVWPSGVSGVDAVFPVNVVLNKKFIKSILSDILGCVDWVEVLGPDSLQLK
jgi:hypothetical protein